MSFSFNGVGTKDEVIRQVRSHHIGDEGLGPKARELVVAALEHDQLGGGPGGYGYIVKAFGHIGQGAPSSLNITIEPLWVPVLHEHVQEVASAQPGDF